ncbi:MAG: hypothetical protein ABW025_01140 [Cellulomonas sp.]
MTRRRSGLLAAGAVVVAALAACSADPVLLDGDDFPGVEETTQNTRSGNVPGPTWCDGMAADTVAAPSSPGTVLDLGDRGTAGAVIIDRSADGLGSDQVLAQLQGQADACADSSVAEQGSVIEPLTGLGDGAIGWTTRRVDGEWGEYVLVPLDEWRLLAVGFSTTQDEPPVELADLVDRAVAGADRFPASEG